MGGYMYNQTLIDKIENISAGRAWGNLDRRALHDRWQNPGDQTYFKNVRDFSTTYASSRFVMKENTLSLSSVNLDYEFEPKQLKHLGLSFLSVGFYAEDVFHASTIRQERGTHYPFARRFSVAISARF